MVPKAVILDFDGTLVESVGVKDDAFRELFGQRAEWPAIEEYHLSHDHMIRFEKFRHITEDICGEPYDETVGAGLAARFSGLVADRIASAPAVPGTDELLEALDAFGVPVYLVSMSPADELDGILERRGLRARFAHVYAHPWGKSDAVDVALRRVGSSPAEVVMVGDSPADARVAADAGVRFIGRDSGKEFEPGTECYPDLHGVLAAIFSPDGKNHGGERSG